MPEDIIPESNALCTLVYAVGACISWDANFRRLSI